MKIKRNTTKILPTLALLLMTTPVIANTTQIKTTEQTTIVNPTTEVLSVSDRGIRESLDNAIDARADLDDDVHFFVKDGVVTLTGTVDTAQEQKDAEKVAYTIQGVTHVVNKLVSESSGLKAEYPNNTTIQQNSTYTETTKSRTTL